MSLKRSFLKELGLEAEVIDKIMTEYGKTFESMVTKSESEEAVKNAVENAIKDFTEKNPKIKATETKEYLDLLAKYDGLLLDGKLRDKKVKSKYFDFVKAKLNKDEDFEKAIDAVKKEYGEFFEEEKEAEQKPEPPKNNPNFHNEPGKENGKVDGNDEKTLAEEFKKAFRRI